MERKRTMDKDIDAYHPKREAPQKSHASISQIELDGVQLARRDGTRNYSR